jgi:hypothetical protein
VWVGAAVPRPEAAAQAGVEAVAPRQEAEARDAAAAVQLREAEPDVRAVQRWVALLLVVPWAFHRDRLRRPARPAP